ncbi:MAG: PHP domain-containing protein [bacterium]|nr:PHP domain-containing protein [bacterium]
MNAIDLHVHSNKSDGSYSPIELVDYALEKKLSAFALTDHDTVDGLDEALSYAQNKPVKVIPGIELSTENEACDVHILGLFINYKNPAFQDYLVKFQESRDLRNEKMCVKLREHGIQITMEDLRKRFPDSVVTRGLYAKYMLETGQIKSMREAFERYIGDTGPCYVPREKVTPEQAIDLIHTADGVAVLAHPVLYHMGTAKLDAFTARLKAAGLDGIEAVYTTYAPSDERDIKRLAAKYELLITGGSDFHGTTKPETDLGIGYGKLFVPEDLLYQLTDYKSRSK